MAIEIGLQTPLNDQTQSTSELRIKQKGLKWRQTHPLSTRTEQHYSNRRRYDPIFNLAPIGYEFPTHERITNLLERSGVNTLQDLASLDLSHYRIPRLNGSGLEHALDLQELARQKLEEEVALRRTIMRQPMS